MIVLRSFRSHRGSFTEGKHSKTGSWLQEPWRKESEVSAVTPCSVLQTVARPRRKDKVAGVDACMSPLFPCSHTDVRVEAVGHLTFTRASSNSKVSNRLEPRKARKKMGKRSK